MKKIGTGAAAFAGMLILILDTKTAIMGASDGVELCIRTVIPSLFPFFILSMLLSSSLAGNDLALLRPIGKLCRIPSGCESLLLIGFLGGYPSGAAAVRQSFEHGTISRQSARRMLGFCSNAGPSFLFGIVGVQFGNPIYAWTLWGIHIVSALLVGVLLPGSDEQPAKAVLRNRISLTDALDSSISAMAKICGWIILFRVILAFLIRWFLWAFPKAMQVALMGLLELTIGCTRLCTAEFPDAFLLASALLSFGGVCVLLQTASVTGDLGLGLYLPGKIMQTSISVFLSALFLRCFCSQQPAWYLFALPPMVLALCLCAVKMKKGVEIRKKMVYNHSIKSWVVNGNAVPQEN